VSCFVCGGDVCVVYGGVYCYVLGLGVVVCCYVECYCVVLWCGGVCELVA